MGIRRGPKPIPLINKFNANLAAGDNGCIVWTGGTNGVGYGVIRTSPSEGRRHVYVHRWSYEHFVGPIADGLHLDHLCRNTLCVNPHHLEPVTLRENVLRGLSSPARNARKLRCLRDHELSGENLYINPTTGYRKCRECARIRDANRSRGNRRKAA